MPKIFFKKILKKKFEQNIIAKKYFQKKYIFTKNIFKKKIHQKYFQKNTFAKYFSKKKVGAKPPCCSQGLGWYRAIARSQPSLSYFRSVQFQHLFQIRWKSDCFRKLLSTGRGCWEAGTGGRRSKASCADMSAMLDTWRTLFKDVVQSKILQFKPLIIQL